MAWWNPTTDEDLAEEARVMADIEALAALRSHPNFQDVVDWIDRAAGMWVGHPRYQGATEAGEMLLKLLRGGDHG